MWGLFGVGRSGVLLGFVVRVEVGLLAFSVRAEILKKFVL